MRKSFVWCKYLSWLTAAALSLTAFGGLTLHSDTEPLVVKAASSDTRIRVDLNKNDGRKASYTKTCYNWIIDSATPSYTVDGVTFKLSNGGSVGQGIDSVNCKILQLQDVEKTPTLTMDGVKIKDGDNGGTIKLEISGLSAGTHSLTTWHSTADAVEISTMSISVNGKTTATGVKAPVRVKDSNDAGMSYSTFTVAAGETVTVLIKPEGNVKSPHFDLDESYSSIPTYYWRVDEIDANGGIVTGAVYSFQVARVAFPTAEGYGRYARGGRGGQIVEVTNLNDSGEGSLRWALCDVKGPRIVVFKVGGVIELKSALVIPEDGGDVYVAGQTAPGDGITLINYDFGGMGTSDAVIRDIRTRVGDMNDTATGGMGLASCNYCIIDHCSISWATDEGFSSRSAANITFQWSIIGESLNNSVHYDASDRSKTERHAFAASISGFTGSFHHNLLINNTGRNWSLAGAMEQDAVTYGGQLDISNNVVYNWMDRTTDGGVRRLNFVGNYYKAGAVSNESLHIVSTDGNELGTSDMQMMYVSGNKMVGYDGTVLLNSTDNAWDKGRAISGGKNSTAADVRSDSPFFENYITLQSADDAYKSVIDNTTGAGANVPALDYIDTRYHNEVTNNKYTYTATPLS